ncbi:hypothetical protein [Mobiluncus mulieris]|nr:hypothetical protein [Mobiluncus mulieris]
MDGAIVIQDQEIIWIGEALKPQAAGFGAQVVAADSPTDGGISCLA